MHFGYVRVSTDDQNLSLQLDALKAAGCEKVFGKSSTEQKPSDPNLQNYLTRYGMEIPYLYGSSPDLAGL